jgi:hypothetical protein
MEYWDRDEPVSYADFRTGFNFGQVYHMIFQRKWKRRKGVLGYWNELKKKLYRQYVSDFWEKKNSKEKAHE